MAAYRITARSLERQQVGELILKEFASLEELAKPVEMAAVPPSAKGKVVLVLEESEDTPHAGAPQRPQ